MTKPLMFLPILLLAVTAVSSESLKWFGDPPICPEFPECPRGMYQICSASKQQEADERCPPDLCPSFGDNCDFGVKTCCFQP
ncbi:uncharacterized protein BYT42DRAFT_574790 [Radiomyces spectabilis]|uniref:uncharacterized protein n=1 Tax=Radiomyces spectabilis TaxID=64574 RepID=UPI00221EDC84|nr:uncharacterized protein BYT42DRAFT_574790 [Radiomyces spectabilis]KAI8376482.1 hypothetical protein BYT42DRAFT_574790 [Radiomyces spectabilis]